MRHADTPRLKAIKDHPVTNTHVARAEGDRRIVRLPPIMTREQLIDAIEDAEEVLSEAKSHAMRPLEPQASLRALKRAEGLIGQLVTRLVKVLNHRATQRRK